MTDNRTHIAKQIDDTNEKARYDACAKNILANKMILAYIFQRIVAEVRDREVKEICNMIEGTPRIGPDEMRTEAIAGLDTADKMSHHGEIDFDVLTWLTYPSNHLLWKAFVNMEMQLDYSPGYDLVTRGVYSAARYIVREKDTEFTGSEYNNLKKVYSIWICMDAPGKYRDTITDHSIRRQDLHGCFSASEYYDLLSVVLIRLGGEPEDYEQGSLQYLLMVLFSDKVPAQQKKRILEQQYAIPMTKELGKEIDNMCNLSEGIERRGIEKGISIGEKRAQETNIKTLMETMHLTAQQAMDALKIPAEKRGLYNLN